MGIIEGWHRRNNRALQNQRRAQFLTVGMEHVKRALERCYGSLASVSFHLLPAGWVLRSQWWVPAWGSQTASSMAGPMIS
jgi:hypothetical protein